LTDAVAYDSIRRPTTEDNEPITVRRRAWAGKAPGVLREHKDNVATHRLRTNKPLTALKLDVLPEMLTEKGTGDAMTSARAVRGVSRAFGPIRPTPRGSLPSRPLRVLGLPSLSRSSGVIGIAGTRTSGVIRGCCGARSMNSPWGAGGSPPGSVGGSGVSCGVAPPRERLYVRRVDGGSLWTSAVVAAAVAAVVTGLFQLFTSFRYLPYRLRTEQDYEQRKALRQLIGTFHGRLLEEAVDWHWRMWTSYNQLNAGVRPFVDRGDAIRAAYKLARLATVLQQFDWEAVYIDQRIALPSDRDFVAFVKLLGSTIVGHSILRERTRPLPRERFDGSVTGDMMRVVCEDMLTGRPVAGGLLSLREFERRAQSDEALSQVVRLLQAADSAEDPGFRWDRLVATHLVAAVFVNAYGYPFQRISVDHLRRIAGELRNDVVRGNLADDLDRFRLDTNDHVAALARILRDPAN